MPVLRRSAPFLFVFCLLLAVMPLVLSGDATAQGSVPIGEFTPAFPDGPPIEIQPISTVPPDGGTGLFPLPSPTPTLEPIVPTEDPPAPDEPDPPPTSVEVVPGSDLPGITPEIVTPTDGVTPLEVLPATITIRTRVCDNQGFNPYVYHPIEAFEAECPYTTIPAAFSIAHTTLALSKVTVDGVVTFEVPANTKVTITGVRPDGYDVSRNMCRSTLQKPIMGLETPMIKPMTWTPQTAESVECTWFLVQNGTDANLALNKSSCPPFDPATLSADTSVFCTDYLDEWGDVTISDSNPTTPDIVRRASEGPTHMLSFIDLPLGTYTVTETNVTKGTAWTYMGHCAITDPADGDHRPTFPVVKSTTFTVTLDRAGDSVKCTSFNVRDSGVSASSMPVGEYEPAFPDGPPIEIVPPGTEVPEIPAAMVPPVTAEPNPDGLEPPPAPDAPPIPTPTLVPIFPTEEPDAPPTGVAVVPGSGLPKPNIPSLIPQTPTLVPIFPVETEEPTVTPVPSPTVTLVPSPTAVTGFGNLTLYSRTCDNQGFNPHFGGTLATFLAECPASDSEFEFTLTGAAGSTYTKTVSTKGGVINEVVPAPGAGIDRTAMPGFDMSYTSCSNDSFNKDYPKAIAHYSGAIVAPGETVTCYWFNVLSSADVNISVAAYTCPAVSPLTTPSVIPREFELDAICTMWPRMGGVTITLADADPSTADQNQVTTSTSDAQFLDLPTGTYTITVTAPAGATHSYMPSCQGDWAGPTLPGPVVVTATGDFTFTVPITVPGETYRCGLYVVKP